MQLRSFFWGGEEKVWQIVIYCYTGAFIGATSIECEKEEFISIELVNQKENNLRQYLVPLQVKLYVDGQLRQIGLFRNFGQIIEIAGPDYEKSGHFA